MSSLADALRYKLAGQTRQAKAQLVPTRLAFMARRGPGFKNISLGERSTHVPVEIPNSVSPETVMLRSRVSEGLGYEHEADGFLKRPSYVSPVEEEAFTPPSLMAGISEEVPTPSLGLDAPFVSRTGFGEEIGSPVEVSADLYDKLTRSVPDAQAKPQPKQLPRQFLIPATARALSGATQARSEPQEKWLGKAAFVVLAAAAGCAWSNKRVREYVWGMLGKGGD